MTKAEIRAKYLTLRKGLGNKNRQSTDAVLCNLFFDQLPVAEIKHFNSFLPIESKGEPNTWLIIERIHRELPNAITSIPVINKSGELDAVVLDRDAELHTNAWGISEVHGGRIISPEEIDLAIVPLLAFSPYGERIGYGKGFYDKFLKRCRRDMLRVGLSAFDADSNLPPPEPHDVPLTHCITPTGVYKF